MSEGAPNGGVLGAPALVCLLHCLLKDLATHAHQAMGGPAVWGAPKTSCARNTTNPSQGVGCTQRLPACTHAACVRPAFTREQGHGRGGTRAVCATLAQP